MTVYLLWLKWFMCITLPSLYTGSYVSIKFSVFFLYLLPCVHHSELLYVLPVEIDASHIEVHSFLLLIFLR